MEQNRLLGIHKAMTKLWLGLAIVISILCVYFMWRDNWEEFGYLVLPPIAWLWYLLRLFMVRRLTKHQEEMDSRS